MRTDIAKIIEAALEEAVKAGELKETKPVHVEKPKREEHGDYSTNIAMLLAPTEKKSPRDVAAAIKKRIETSPLVSKCEIAGPGFVNVFLKKSYWHELLGEIIEKGNAFGKTDAGKGKKVLLEFVSANPTGPLHIGHGRGAAVGDALANIMKAAGFDVKKEYYINDRGRQIQTLGESVRAKAEGTPLPEDGYKGAYVDEIAAAYKTAGAKESYEDFACDEMLKRIKTDLESFGVSFDVWTSERRDIFETGLVKKGLDALEEKGFVYEQNGAKWFKSKQLGDDKDRVLEKSGGELTYFATDVAYHKKKVDDGFDSIIDVWGADHHGYEARVRASLKALGLDDSKLKIIFIQLVALLRNGEPVAMGKREGEFVTLKEVIDEVGMDATRYFFLMRRSDAHLDFDLELAKKQAPENPVFYVQYCHARIHSIITFAKESGLEAPKPPLSGELLGKLDTKDELDIIKHLAAFEETVAKSALDMEPHRITFYLQELASLFHPYYNKNRVVTEDKELSLARLALCRAIATVAKNGLTLLGVLAPEKM
ncbi:MAG: arginine--tRNA ligase [Deltaproteobacteria bacterium]|nr:arginine--tRNA ligase [Deltaproteobacteria bacterium]